MSWKSYILPILAAIGVMLAIMIAYLSSQTPPAAPILFPPPSPPFENFIATQGLVEASTEDINIASPFSEVVKTVYVHSGETVELGTPLFELDTRVRRALLEEAKASLEVAKAEYSRQLDLPRKEDIPPLCAIVNQAKANYQGLAAQFEIIENITNPKAVSRDEYVQKKFSAEEAEAQLLEAEANLEKLLAGAWSRDLSIYRNQLIVAQRKVEGLEEEIAMSTIKAPFAGTVLKVNIREDEFADASGNLQEPLLIFGKIKTLNIRVDVDEEEVWRIIEGAKAFAYVRGNSSISTEIFFLRLIPYLIPKRSIAGDTQERIDTRVLQLLFMCDRQDLPIYPGMLMDIFMEAKPYPFQTTDEKS